jgi:hypothetical protein
MCGVRGGGGGRRRRRRRRVAAASMDAGAVVAAAQNLGSLAASKFLLRAIDLRGEGDGAVIGEGPSVLVGGSNRD